MTRRGFEARIICFDHIGQYPIIALVKSSDGTQETIQQYRLNGAYSQNNSPFDLFMAAPAIPEGFTAYDPNVPPPENAEEIEMVYALGRVLVQDRHFFAQDWEKYNGYFGRDVRTHYRVTKWKEARPSLDDVIKGVVLSLEDASLMCIKEKEALAKSLQQFADVIVQLAVDKIREDRRMSEETNTSRAEIGKTG